MEMTLKDVLSLIDGHYYIWFLGKYDAVWRRIVEEEKFANWEVQSLSCSDDGYAIDIFLKEED